MYLQTEFNCLTDPLLNDDSQYNDDMPPPF